jgi:hypothetical protein
MKNKIRHPVRIKLSISQSISIASQQLCTSNESACPHGSHDSIKTSHKQKMEAGDGRLGLFKNASFCAKLNWALTSADLPLGTIGAASRQHPSIRRDVIEAKLH